MVINIALANNSDSFLSYKALKRGQFEVYYLSVGVNYHYNIIIALTSCWQVYNKVDAYPGPRALGVWIRFEQPVSLISAILIA